MCRVLVSVMVTQLHFVVALRCRRERPRGSNRSCRGLPNGASAGPNFMWGEAEGKLLETSMKLPWESSSRAKPAVRATMTSKNFQYYI